MDIETGKVVTEWKFEKVGADINMRDITNDSKGAQLDPLESTLGQDRTGGAALCRILLVQLNHQYCNGRRCHLPGGQTFSALLLLVMVPLLLDH